MTTVSANGPRVNRPVGGALLAKPPTNPNRCRVAVLFQPGEEFPGYQPSVWLTVTDCPPSQVAAAQLNSSPSEFSRKKHRITAKSASAGWPDRTLPTLETNQDCHEYQATLSAPYSQPPGSSSPRAPHRSLAPATQLRNAAHLGHRRIGPHPLPPNRLRVGRHPRVMRKPGIKQTQGYPWPGPTVRHTAGAETSQTEVTTAPMLHGVQGILNLLMRPQNRIGPGATSVDPALNMKPRETGMSNMHTTSRSLPAKFTEQLRALAPSLPALRRGEPTNPPRHRAIAAIGPCTSGKPSTSPIEITAGGAFYAPS